jgi:hypothetical protein
MPSEKLAKLSLQAALRTLDIQERAVEQLRTRTGMLLGASSLIASVFGGETIRYSGGPGPLAALALGSLAASVGLCVYVLLPKRGLTFGLDATNVNRRLLGKSDSTVDHEVLLWLTSFAHQNEIELAGLDRAYVLAALCLMAQLSSWSIPLIARVG